MSLHTFCAECDAPYLAYIHPGCPVCYREKLVYTEQDMQEKDQVIRNQTVKIRELQEALAVLKGHLLEVEEKYALATSTFRIVETMLQGET